MLGRWTGRCRRKIGDCRLLLKWWWWRRRWQWRLDAFQICRGTKHSLFTRTLISSGSKCDRIWRVTCEDSPRPTSQFGLDSSPPRTQYHVELCYISFGVLRVGMKNLLHETAFKKKNNLKFREPLLCEKAFVVFEWVVADWRDNNKTQREAYVHYTLSLLWKYEKTCFISLKTYNHGSQRMHSPGIDAKGHGKGIREYRRPSPRENDEKKNSSLKKDFLQTIWSWHNVFLLLFIIIFFGW